MPTSRLTTVVAVATLGLLGLTACSGSSSTAGGPPDRIEVVSSFYPLAYLAERVGGDLVAVSNLTAAGAEPHDLELSPKDVAAIAGADQVVYLEGFQPAVDDAVAGQASDTSWDAARFADLTLTYTPIEEGQIADDEAGSTDPHFWLDPTRYAAVARAYADALSALQPSAASTFQANASALTSDLEALDEEWTTATATCANRDLVTSHNAFGYLADHYAFTQRGITGLTPEAEPSPQALASTADFVRTNGVTTIYYETLVSPAIAETLASETGASTAVLDPLEGLSDASAGADYLAVMRANLTAVVEGQGCG